MCYTLNLPKEVSFHRNEVYHPTQRILHSLCLSCLYVAIATKSFIGADRLKSTLVRILLNNLSKQIHKQLRVNSNITISIHVSST